MYSRYNAGYKYVLIVINAFSKFLWAEPLKTKNAKGVSRVFEKILKESKTNANNLQVDHESELYNKDFKELMKKYNINMYSSFTRIKASMAERVIKHSRK